jgi:hypothetical protein
VVQVTKPEFGSVMQLVVVVGPKVPDELQVTKPELGSVMQLVV